MSLLLAEPGLELSTGTLREGSRLTLIPSAEGGSTTEAYLILSGRLRRDGEVAIEVGPGDLLVAGELEGEVVFSPLSEVHFAYITTRPSFHEISAELQDLMRLAVEVETKDGYTADHCRRLQALAYAAGCELGMGAHRLHLLDYGAYLHDVGKVRIPVEILTKPGKLDEEEWRIIRRHPVFGRDMLQPTFLRDSGPIVEQHHERMDGSGYPYGLAGDEILPESYLVAIADTYDAMTTDRSYRAAVGRREALDEIERLAGTAFPVELVRAFQAGLARLERERNDLL